MKVAVKMKGKRFVILSISVLVILTLVISTLPVFQVEYRESTLRQKPIADGDIYYYQFSTVTTFFTNRSSISLSALPWGIQQSGNIILTVGRNNVTVKRIVHTPSIPELKVYNSSTYVNVSTYSLNSSFMQNFINSVPRKEGTFTSIQDEFGIVKGNVVNLWGYYNDTYTGSNQTLLNDYGAQFYTVPFAIEFPKVANSSATTWVPYNVFNLYDFNGMDNILVESMLGGNSPFLNDIIKGSISLPNATTPVILNSEYYFNMKLVATNVMLGPLAFQYYLLEYLPIAIVLWILVLPSVYFTVIRKKKRR